MSVFWEPEETDLTEMTNIANYHIVHSALVTAARHRPSIRTFHELADLIGLATTGSQRMKPLFEILKQINVSEHALGRPLLSAIAVNVNGGPCEGFWGIAKELRRFNGDSEDEKRRFWEKEKRAVYAVRGRPAL